MPESDLSNVGSQAGSRPVRVSQATMKRTLRALLSCRWVAPAWMPLLRGGVPIFTLHRFAVQDLDVYGHDPVLLRQVLERLRRERFNVMGLDELVRAFVEHRCVPPRTVVFTVDDGYADFALVAADIFLAYDCPVTVFLPTAFIHGATWLWWDRVAYAALTTRKRSVRITLGNDPLDLAFTDPPARRRLAGDLSRRLTRFEESWKQEFIARLSLAAEVDIPSKPPAQFAGMDWADVRRLEARGVMFGPHTMTHPVLTRTTSEQAAREIRESWRVLCIHARRPVCIFCYPNGSFGRREVDLVAEAGLTAAVTSVPGYASPGRYRRTADDRFAIPRFPYPDDVDGLCLTASGFTRVALPLQRAMRRRRRIADGS